MIDGAACCVDPDEGLDALVRALATDGYRVLGPILNGAVVTYGEVQAGADLPTGVHVDQAPGRWRLRETDDGTRFAYTPGAASWKEFVHPPHQEVLRLRGADGTWRSTVPVDLRPLALVGARDCELRALGVLDRVLADPEHPDPRYLARRGDPFVVAVTCGEPAATCWCTSRGGGPQPQERFDLRITELAGPPRLLVEAASERGAAVAARLGGRPATADDFDTARAVVDGAVALLPVRLDEEATTAALAGCDEDPHWDDVAARCLSCGNCTTVCPTCFCVSLTDQTAVGTDDVVRVQEWASCFQLDHSWLGGRPVRSTTASRYRQWLLHKLHTWPEQFGTTGCVGCGRCTTWCPAGIDLVAEARALTSRETP